MPIQQNRVDPQRRAQWEGHWAAVGAKIRALRTERGLTQEALALTSGVSWNILIKVERGQRGILYERLFDLAKVLQVTPDELLRPIEA